MKTSKLLTVMSLCGLLLVAGCASRPTMEELEKEAQATGDWTAVQQRRAMDRKMGRVDPNQVCAAGYALLCEQKGEREECACVSSNTLRPRQ